MNSGADNRSVSGALSGKKAFIAASGRLLPDLAAGLRLLGADTLPVPVLEAKGIEDTAALDRAIANINQYDWIIFTSAWGVSFFAKRLGTRGVPPACSKNRGQNVRINGEAGSFVITSELPKICAIGPATAAAVEKHGYSIAITADEFTAEGVMQSIERYHGGRKNLDGLGILIPRAVEARDFLPIALAAAGCRVDTIPCYKTVLPEPDAELTARLRNETPDLVVFTSAKAVRNFLKVAAAAAGETTARRRLREAAAAVIGPVTAAALESEGKSAEIIPAESAVPALLSAIADHFKTD